EGATVLQGKPEEVRELIDASPYAKKYTSGVLSFAEAELLPGQQFSLRERQHAGGVLFRIRRGIDKLPDFLRFSLQHGRPL
ncbi:hypothetical protein ACSLOR_29245, partial [Klebsiella pneumoniae]|uniref:hypothetical protein n=1 Tax=Klebsiella pneumoniae TaxID=573 RepID=UPI003EE2D210